MGTARGAALAEHPFAGSQDNIKATCSQLHFPMRPKRRSGRKRMRSQLFLEELPREQEPCVVIFVLSVSFPPGPCALRGSCPPADMNSFQSLCTTLRFQVWAETPHAQHADSRAPPWSCSIGSICFLVKSPRGAMVTPVGNLLPSVARRARERKCVCEQPQQHI